MKKIFNLFAMIKHDLRTMHWPNKSETQKSFFIVMILAFVLGLYIFGLDTLFTELYQMVIF